MALTFIVPGATDVLEAAISVVQHMGSGVFCLSQEPTRLVTAPDILHWAQRGHPRTQKITFPSSRLYCLICAAHN